MLSTSEQSLIKADTPSRNSLDLAFLLDCTGSMQPYIDMSKDQIKGIISDINAQYPEWKIRIGIVGYRDVKDKKRFEVFNFSAIVDEVRSFLDSLRAEGGNDIAEDVNGGFQQALYNLDWKSESKLLYHIADAPCHGRKFHQVSDDFPKGHPEDKPWEDIIDTIVKMEINYIFYKILGQTDQMFESFKKMFDKHEAVTLFKQDDIIYLSLRNNPPNMGSLFGCKSSKTHSLFESGSNPYPALFSAGSDLSSKTSLCGGGFGDSKPTPHGTSGGLFGGGPTNPNPTSMTNTGGLFGAGFGGGSTISNPSGGSLFGSMQIQGVTMGTTNTLGKPSSILFSQSQPQMQMQMLQQQIGQSFRTQASSYGQTVINNTINQRFQVSAKKS